MLSDTCYKTGALLDINQLFQRTEDVALLLSVLFNFPLFPVFLHVKLGLHSEAWSTVKVFKGHNMISTL